MKRITALIIAAIMIASMIPAAFAATGEETEPAYNFQFNRDSHSLADGEDVKIPKNYTVENTKENYDKWGYINTWRCNTARVQTSYSYGNWKNTSSHFSYKYDPDNNVLPVFMTLEIVIDQPGTYTPSLEWTEHDNSPHVDLYLIKAPTNADEVAVWKTATGSGQTKDLKAKCYERLKGVAPLGTVKMQKNDGDSSPMTFSNSPVTVTKDDIGSYYLVFVPNGASKTVAENLDGTTEIDCNIQPKSFSLTRVAEDEEIKAAFSPESTPATGYNEPTVITISKDGSEIKSVKNADGTHNITAPETNKNGAKFIYWAKGLSTQKRILIGKTNVLENYVPDAKYANYLIPVYEDEVSGTEYYNANGQLIPDAKEETRVSMAGYGASNGWQQYGDKNIYVATYEKEVPENVTITVDGEEQTVAYGTTVICEADETKENFKCWKKSNINGDEIVSVDKTYKFKAWENCIVTAVYEEHTPVSNAMKIIIDDFTIANGVIGVMAEFIGLDSAVEKGIMFTDSEENTTQIAMTTKDNQFTVIADKEGTYKGYAILKNGDAYNLITDGSYEKSAE